MSLVLSVLMVMQWVVVVRFLEDDKEVVRWRKSEERERERTK